MTLTILDTLASYVPNLITRRLAVDSAAPETPISEHLSAAVLFADISGFTSLTEHLAERGSEGLEDLSRLLNIYFGQLIDLITDHGGDIVKFAGDALLAIWTADEGEPAALSTAVRRAAQCAIAIQAALHDKEVTEGRALSMRLGVGSGDVLVMHLGGMYGRWELLITGHAIIQASLAENQATPGQVVLSLEAWSHCQNYVSGQPLFTGGVILHRIVTELPLNPLQPTDLTPAAESALRAYIPGAITNRVAARQTSWLAELRRITVLFINLPGMTDNTPLEQAQTTILSLQTALYRYEGSINKLNVDDKGITLIAALGLPPFAHEDDSLRGVQAAIDMYGKLQEMGLRSSIGITSGRAFCGSIGNVNRREYTMIGDVVNLAARLMQAVKQVVPLGELPILADTTTTQATQSRVTFVTFPPQLVKGKVEPVPVFQPVRVNQPTAVTLAPTSEMVGRFAERTLLQDYLYQLTQSQSHLILIEGEAGIGKSRLVADLKHRAELKRLTVLMGSGDALDKSTPYHAWRGVFYQLFDLSVMVNPNDQRRHLLDLLEDEPELLRLAPLLNSVLSLNLPDNSYTEQMMGEVRSINTLHLLVRLLQDSASRSPKVIVLEDAHWLDSSSWALAWAVSQQVRPLLFILSARPLSEPIPSEYNSLRRLAQAHIVLDSLSRADISALVARRLGATHIPEPILDLIHEKAEGHPFFSEEMAYALRDSGYIIIENQECRIAVDVDLTAVSFPNTIEGIITSRIDRLTPSQQLTLKVASVIGRLFSLAVLEAIHPVEEDRDQLSDYLGILAKLDITALDSPEPDQTYIFKHIITQQVAYNLMLFAQRRQLHRATAEWYERTFHADLSPYYPLLAHHWSQAEEVEKAIHYYSKAAEQALRNYANREAIKFISEAMMLEQNKQSDQSPVSSWQKMLWQRELGVAYLALGDLLRAQEHLQIALSLLDHPLPKNYSQLLFELLAQVGQQLLHRLWPSRYVVGAGVEQTTTHEVLLETAVTYEHLSDIFYVNNQVAQAAYVVIRTLNLTEQVPPAPERARAYSAMGVAAGLSRLRRFANRYRRIAIVTAQQYAANHLPTQARVGILTAVYHLNQGSEWADAFHSLQEAMTICEQLGDRRQLGTAMMLWGFVSEYNGQFSQAQKAFNDLYEMAIRREDIQQQTWALEGLAWGDLLQSNRAGEATQKLKKVTQLLENSADRSAQILAGSLLSYAYWRQGHRQLALTTADGMAYLIFQRAPTLFTGYRAYSSLLDTYLSALEEFPSELSQANYTFLRQLLFFYRQFATRLPLAWAGVWLAQGWYDWLRGRHRQAQQNWAKCLTAAEKSVMPYETARAHYEIGRHATTPHERRYHLVKAVETFNRLQADYDLQKATRLLEAED